MPTVNIPLVGSFNQRGIDADAALQLQEDQRFKDVVFTLVQNPVTQKSKIYVEKRPGWKAGSLVSTGIASTGLIQPQAFASPFSAFGETNSATYVGTVNVGNITGRALHFSETLVSASSYVVLKSSDGTGWYYANGAKDVLAYTGNTSSGGFTISSMSATAGLYTGQLITGPQVGAGARVSSINVATSTIGLTVTTSAASSAAALTKEPIAKILSANFLASTSYVSGFAPMDGYLFYATDDGYVNNSDLNTVSVYSANARLAVQGSPDATVGVAVQKNVLVAFGLNSNEKFQNAGYSTGSPLQVIKSQIEHVGAVDQRSITGIEDDIYFVATPSEGDVGVYRMRGFNSQRISNSIVDKIIGTASLNGAIYASAFRLGGYPYLALYVSMAQDGPSSDLLLESGDVLLLETTPGGNILLEDSAGQSASYSTTLIYNITLNIWAEWDADTATFIDSAGTGTSNQLVATSRCVSSGYVYTINPVSDGALYQDNGVTISSEIRTSKIDFGTNDKKYIKSIKLNGDTVTSAAASTVSLYWSDDDYQTWKGPLYFDMSGQSKSVHRLGAHYGGRAYKLLHHANGPFRAESLEITYDRGSP